LPEVSRLWATRQGLCVRRQDERHCGISDTNFSTIAAGAAIDSCSGGDYLHLRPILTYGPANMAVSWRGGLNPIALPPIEDRMRA
jgi:hypothetical protein